MNKALLMWKKKKE